MDMKRHRTRRPTPEPLDALIRATLAEDMPEGDVTSEAVFARSDMGKGVFRVKQDGVVAGLAVAGRVFAVLDRRCRFRATVKDGNRVKAGTIIAEVRGPVRALLAGERTALNLLQRMSGIATMTRQYVDAVRGLPVKVLDTRKTAPGLRAVDKLAVKIGGGTNHRFSLSDMAMLKDNHIKAAGSIVAAVKAVRRRAPGVRVEVEAATLDQVREAVEAGADIVMLDNMSLSMMRKAVRLVAGRAKIEASGSVTLKTLRTIALTGVDFVSVGRITHSAPALDISMKLV